MNKFKLFRLKNWMFFGNFISNIIGVQIVHVISHRSISPPSAKIMELVGRVDRVFMPLSFCLASFLILLYERPIRLYLNDIYRKMEPTKDQTIKARQRLLNEPFVLIAINMMIWLAAAIIYPTAFHLAEAGLVNIGRIFWQTLLVGLVTSIIAFFLLERILQKRLVPQFFPNGGLYMTPKTLRIRIRTRLAAMVFACNIVPCLAFLGTIKGSYFSEENPEQLLDLLRGSIFTNCLIFIGVGLFLTYLVSSNLTRPFGEIIQVLRGIKRGRLDRKVRVTSNDEIGYTGDVINGMAEGLKEREKMRQSLDLAREVQQNLLPKLPPAFKGLDIAGKSIYCDQTGGDYFDFLDLGKPQGSKVGLVVGDVSGHGIPSALLMATARAFLRLRSFLPGSAAQVVMDVNRQLVMDVEDTGQFMTLFYLVIYPEDKSIEWVRAGHDPGIFYDPQTDMFTELWGTGIALGVDKDWQYEQKEMAGLTSGQIIVLGTDGIWEARNSSGKMFGKKRIQEIIRGHRSESAAEIVKVIEETLIRFQKDADSEDDVTLVVVKFD